MENLTKLRPFQLILIGVFTAFALAGLVMFAAFRGFDKDRTAISLGVEIWGTIDAVTMRTIMAELADQNDDWRQAQYIQKDARTFQSEFTNALAEDRGPDVVIISSDLLVQSRNKLWSMNAISERDFKDAYVEAADIFRFPEGMYAFPLVVDPLVMYWNRDLFAAKGLATPPRTWEEFTATAVPRLTTRSLAGQIVESGAALGEYVNIQNAKAILLALILQAGGQPVAVTSDGRYSVNINRAVGNVPLPPADAALRFYTDFANPSTTVYTWSRSFPTDRAEFLAGDVAIYFGFASERRGLEAGNPNLNFDIVEIPQSAGATTLRTFGTVYGVAIARNSDNALGAFEAARGLSSQYVASELANKLDVAPAHRALIAAGSTDPFAAILLRAALISRGWLDPNPSTTGGIFKSMIEDVTSGRLQVHQATRDASERLQYAF